MRSVRLPLLALTMSLCVSLLAVAQTDFEKAVNGMNRMDGFIPFYINQKSGKILLEVSTFGKEFLYVNSLPTGVGSNDIGLDRGQLGAQRVVSFYRSGPKVLLTESNYSYRATSENPAERRAVRDAFATSVLWGFDVVAEQGDNVLLDATTFFQQDAYGVGQALQRSRQGTYRLDASRCALYYPNIRNFPKNTEIEALITVTGDSPGRWVRSVVPTPEAVTVHERWSFVELPDNDYTPRPLDPRSGYFGISYMDYATPIGEPMVKQFIARHRLRKKDPSAAISDPVTPIVYYVDPGTPEPIRSALVEGASWWNQAFEAAGYRNAFQVKILPADADPMDVRYNVIQWVHRSTRGWSYGSAITDPRTGEIIKGHVSLGSLRIRQDYLIAEGLLSPYKEGKPVPKDMLEMSLARIRQLAAHEVGHTIGLAHNYIASAEGRASVMDYPHPIATLRRDGSIDVTNAYATGIGEWDKVAVAYGYQDFPVGTDEHAALTRTITDAMKRGLIFLTDQDARPAGSAHPQVHLWDNGSNAVDELDRVMAVRKAALSHFSEDAIQPGMPMATLEEALVPLYLGHRYQAEAASKVVGGLTYTYAMRGDGQIPTIPVPGAEQLRALNALLRTITPDALELPERIIRLIPPRPFAWDRHRELFSSRTGLTFDPLAPVEVAADHVLGLLLQNERAAPFVEQHAADKSMPGLAEVIDAIIDATWKAKPASGFTAEVQRTIDAVALRNLLALAADTEGSVQSAAIANAKIDELEGWLTRVLKKTNDADFRAAYVYAQTQIEKYRKDPQSVQKIAPAVIPPGQPIGMMEDWCGQE